MTRSRRHDLHSRALRTAVALILSASLTSCDRTSSLTPAQQIQDGYAQFQSGEWNLAAADYEAARAAANPNTPEYRQATYWLGVVCYCRRPGEDRARAKALFQDVITSAPTSDEAAWSLLGIARAQQLVPVGDPVDWPAVRNAYQRVIDTFPNHLAADEAFIDLQTSYVLSLDPADAHHAATELTRFLAQHPKSKFVSSAWELLAGCHQTLDEPRQRLDCEIKALETREIDPSNPTMNASGSYWTIATIAQYDVGDFVTATKYYRLFVKEFPNDQRTFAAMQALDQIAQLERQFRAEKPPAAVSSTAKQGGHT